MADGQGMITRSWAETQSLAEKAALGIGVPFAQAARFGAATARHCAEGRPADVLLTVLDKPDAIIALSLEVERAVEAASLMRAPYEITDVSQTLAASFLQALPCDVALEPVSGGLSVSVHLQAPQKRPRPARLEMSQALWDRLQALAERTYVPDSAQSKLGAGAGLMDLD